MQSRIFFIYKLPSREEEEEAKQMQGSNRNRMDHWQMEMSRIVSVSLANGQK